MQRWQGWESTAPFGSVMGLGTHVVQHEVTVWAQFSVWAQPTGFCAFLISQTSKNKHFSFLTAKQKRVKTDMLHTNCSVQLGEFSPAEYIQVAFTQIRTQNVTPSTLLCIFLIALFMKVIHVYVCGLGTETLVHVMQVIYHCATPRSHGGNVCHQF